jgi:hypothetical protein
MPVEAERHAGCGPDVGEVAVVMGASETVLPDPVEMRTHDPPSIAERPAVDAGTPISAVGIVST